MSNRLTSLLDEYRRRPDSKADQSIWQFVAERDPHVFSHHPVGSAFRDHVWKIGGLYLCQGCVMTLAGIAGGGIFFVVTGWLRWFSDLELAIIFVALLTPTVLVQLGRVPRLWKHVARFLLGVLMASALIFLFVTDSWLVRGAVVAAYFAVKIPLERKRHRENQQILRSNEAPKER